MRLMILGALLALAACNKVEPDMKMGQATPVGRIEVSRIGVFEDGIAYGSTRGIYIIKDRETGKEYIGISGIGISETGQHGGKNRTEDER